MIRREQRGGDAQGRAANGGPGGSQAVREAPAKEAVAAVPQGKAASRSWWWQAELGVLHPLSPFLEVG
jgi:hypothetical protein